MGGRSKFGEFDARPFFEMAEMLQVGAEKWDEFIFQLAQSTISGEFIAALKRHTPVDTGELRGAWAIESVTRIGNDISIVVINDKNYASFVNDGHRTPPLKTSEGEPPKQNWVEGQFFVEAALDEMEEYLETAIAKQAFEFLSKLLDGGGI